MIICFPQEEQLPQEKYFIDGEVVLDLEGNNVVMGVTVRFSVDETVGFIVGSAVAFPLNVGLEVIG